MNSNLRTEKLLLNKQLLIFDFDGTVADTTPLHEAAFTQVLAPLGISVDYATIAGLNTLDAMMQCISNSGLALTHADIVELVLAKQQCVRQMISRGLEPRPGIDSFLRWAKPRFHMAMATSGSRGTVTLALEKLGYTGWFDPLVCADDVVRSKPDPECYLKVLQFTGIGADKTVVFEDSEAGFQATTNAGIKYIDAQKFDWAIPEAAS